MRNQRENDCVSRLIALFGCFYVSSIFDIGIQRRKDVQCEIVNSFCRLFLLSTYMYMGHDANYKRWIRHKGIKACLQTGWIKQAGGLFCLDYFSFRM